MLDTVESENEDLIRAFNVAAKHFPEIPAEDMLKSIELCRSAKGLFVKSHIVFAGFRYHPGKLVDGRRMFDIVEKWDIDVLDKLDLTDGPVVHIVFFSCASNGQRIVRRIIDVLKVEGASCHRIKNGGRVFSLRRNVRYKREQFDA